MYVRPSIALPLHAFPAIYWPLLRRTAVRPLALLAIGLAPGVPVWELLAAHAAWGLRARVTPGSAVLVRVAAGKQGVISAAAALHGAARPAAPAIACSTLTPAHARSVNSPADRENVTEQCKDR